MSVYLTEFLDYPKQLETKEWKARRKDILKRDNCRCLFCGKSESKEITIDNQTFHIGHDYAHPQISSSDYIILENGIKLMDEKKMLNINKLKHGPLPLSKQIGALSPDGIFYYTVWKANDNYKKIQKEDIYIARLLCSDGYIANVLYIDEDSLDDLELYRVYIQKEATVLNVHHKRYIIGHKAWEYEDEDLVTLCQNCHSKVHEFLPVHIHEKKNGRLEIINYTPCIRCNGMGYLPEYRHVNNGICFRCKGTRFEELITDDYSEKW